MPSRRSRLSLNIGVNVARPSASGTITTMHAILGTVVDGKIVVDGPSLPEGTVVTVLTPDDESMVKLPPHLERELLAAIDEADRETGGAGPEFLESLKRYG